MISILILKMRGSRVGELIRKRFAASESLQMFGNALADAWAWFAVFVVMALWFVWALDVQQRLSHPAASRSAALRWRSPFGDRRAGHCDRDFRRHGAAIPRRG